MASSARYIQVAPLSRDFFARLANCASASGANVGMLAYAGLRDIVPGLPALPSIRYRVDPAPLVGGFVVRLYVPREVHATVDAWLYATNEHLSLREQLKRRLLIKYGRIANDDAQLPINFEPPR